MLWQCKGFLVFQVCPTVGRLGVRKKLGRDIIKTADPHRPKGCSMSYRVMLSNKNWGKGYFCESSCCSETEWALVYSLRWWLITFASFFFFFSFIYWTIYVSTHEVFCFCSFYFLPQLTWGGSKQAAVWCLAAYKVNPHHRRTVKLPVSKFMFLFCTISE